MSIFRKPVFCLPPHRNQIGWYMSTVLSGNIVYGKKVPWFVNYIWTGSSYGWNSDTLCKHDTLGFPSFSDPCKWHVPCRDLEVVWRDTWFCGAGVFCTKVTLHPSMRSHLLLHHAPTWGMVAPGCCINCCKDCPRTPHEMSWHCLLASRGFCAYPAA